MHTPSDMGGVAHLSFEKNVNDCYRGIRTELREAGYIEKKF